MLKQKFMRRPWLLLLASSCLLAVPTQEAMAVTPQIKAAGDHAALLKDDGSIWQWGVTDYGRAKLYSGNCSLTTTTSVAPVQITGLGAIRAIAVAQYRNIALQSDGTVWAWGRDPQMTTDYGCTALNPYHTVWQIKDSADASGNLSNVTAIWASSGSFFARKTDGSVVAWGSNDTNKLGISAPSGTTKTANPPANVANISTPLQVTQLRNLVGGVSTPIIPTAITSGGSHTLALLLDRSVRAWSGDAYGERGDGSYNHGSFPYWNGYSWYDVATASSINGVSDLVTAPYKSMALKSDGTVWAWGWNQNGELGNGIPWGINTAGSNTPVQITELSGVAAIAMGSQHSVALLSNGTVWAWGWNGQGQLGQNPFPTATHTFTAPIQVTGLTGITAIDASAGCSVALKNDGTVWEWGYCTGAGIAWQPFQINFNGPAMTKASCGTADGQAFTNGPTTNLCLVGNATPVSGSAPWSWQCNLGSTSSASCSASKGPYIFANPSDVRVFQGLNATLKVIAQGANPLQYQWYRVGVPGDVKVVDRRAMQTPVSKFSAISGSTTAQLKITGVRSADGGSYYVVVTDQNGSATSKPALLNVLAPLTPTKPTLPK